MGLGTLNNFAFNTPGMCLVNLNSKIQLHFQGVILISLLYKSLTYKMYEDKTGFTLLLVKQITYY